MYPDFLIIPKVVYRDKKLRPTDLVVYAAIYWYEHMKDGKCFAANNSLADIAQVSERAVMSSLDRLEKQGYIEREYDENKSRRVGIKCLVFYSKQMPEGSPQNKKQPQLPGLEMIRPETPGEFADRFFSQDKEALKTIMTQILLKTHGRGEDKILREVGKFISYWTEPNKSGTKVRWQLESTFDIQRRLYTWLARAGSSSNASASKSGAGVTV